MIITQTIKVVYEARFEIRYSVHRERRTGERWEPVEIAVDFSKQEDAFDYLATEIAPHCSDFYYSSSGKSTQIARTVIMLRHGGIERRAFVHHVIGVYEVVTTQRLIDSPADALPLYSGFEPMIGTKLRTER